MKSHRLGTAMVVATSLFLVSTFTNVFGQQKRTEVLLSKQKDKILTESIYTSPIPSITQYPGVFSSKKSVDLGANSTGELSISGRVKNSQDVELNSVSFTRTLPVASDYLVSLYNPIDSKAGVYRVTPNSSTSLTFTAASYGDKIDTTYENQVIVFTDNQPLEITKKSGKKEIISDWTFNVSSSAQIVTKAEPKEAYTPYTIAISRQYSPALVLGNGQSLDFPLNEFGITNVKEMPKISFTLSSIAAGNYTISRYDGPNNIWIKTDTILSAGWQGTVYIKDANDAKTNKFLYMYDKNWNFPQYPLKFFISGQVSKDKVGNYYTPMYYLSDKTGRTDYSKDGNWHEVVHHPETSFSFSNQSIDNTSRTFSSLAFNPINTGIYAKQITPIYEFSTIMNGEVIGYQYGIRSIYGENEQKYKLDKDGFFIFDMEHPVYNSNNGIYVDSLVGRMPYDYIDPLGFWYTTVSDSNDKFQVALFDNPKKKGSANLNTYSKDYKKDMNYYDNRTLTKIMSASIASDSTIAADLPITFKFNKLMDISTINANTVTVEYFSPPIPNDTNAIVLGKVPVNYMFGDSSVTLSPASKWVSGTAHIVTFTEGVKGADGKEMAMYTLRFNAKLETEVKEKSFSKPEIKVYPNPASGNITIEWPGKASLSIYNLYGQRVGLITNEDGKQIIPTDMLSSGTYFLQAVLPKEILTTSFSVVK